MVNYHPHTYPALSLLIGSGLVFSYCSDAQAVQAAVGDGVNVTYNTTPPPTGAPWDNVVDVNGASGVYLGGGWVLTAEHVGFDNDIVIDGYTHFSTDVNCRFDIDNSNGSEADLFLFRLDTAPLNDVIYDLSIGGLTEGGAVTMIGRGGGAKAWGTNVIENILGWQQNIAVGSTISNYTDFDLGTANDGQAVGGDSGGGVFNLVGGQWQLGGITFAVSTTNDPDLTFIADMDIYGSQIENVMQTHGDAMPVPEPSSGLLILATATGFLARRRRRSAAS